jgi:superfamily II DNA or RNA helicase
MCSYHPTGYQFSPKFQEGTWDGLIYLAYKLKYGGFSFPSGLINSVVSFLVAEDFKVHTEYNYELPKPNKIRQPKVSTLRDYQLEAVQACLRQRRGILKLPTGSGKTKIAAALIRTLKRYTIFLTHKKDLLYQTRDVFRKEIGDFVGIVGDGKRELDAPIAITSVQTLARNPDLLKSWAKQRKVLFADEVHHAVAKTWYKSMQRIPAYYRIGLTATPITGEGKILLEASTGPIIYTAPAQQLIDDGWLSQPIIKMITVKTPVLPERWDYDKSYYRGITISKTRNTKILRVCQFLIKHKNYKPIVVQVRYLDHLKRLQTKFERHGLNFEVLQGSDTADRRNRVFGEINDGKLDVLLVSGIFDEGIDLPNIRTLIIGAGGSSDVRTIQLMGRGMRRTKDKDEVLIVDFFDYTHEYLERHSKRRRRTYKREGYEVETMTLKGLKRWVTSGKKLYPKGKQLNLPVSSTAK